MTDRNPIIEIEINNKTFKIYIRLYIKDLKIAIFYLAIKKH